MNTLVAEGKEINEMSPVSELFTEGETGEVRFYLDRNLSQYEIEYMQDDILSQGVVLTEPIIQEHNILVVKFQKTLWPLLIIGGAVTAITGLFGWQIFKSVQAGVPLWVWGVGGAAVLYLLLREPAKAAVKAAPTIITYMAPQTRAGKLAAGYIKSRK